MDNFLVRGAHRTTRPTKDIPRVVNLAGLFRFATRNPCPVLPLFSPYSLLYLSRGGIPILLQERLAAYTTVLF